MGKFKWVLLAVMAILNNELFSWLVLLILAAAFIAPLVKGAVDRG